MVAVNRKGRKSGDGTCAILWVNDDDWLGGLQKSTIVQKSTQQPLTFLSTSTTTIVFFIIQTDARIFDYDLVDVK